MSMEPHQSRSEKRRKKSGVSEQEKQLQELVFGKDIIAATSARQQSVIVQATKHLSSSINGQHNVETSSAPVAAWEDDDDLEVDLYSSSRLKKLHRANDKDGTNENKIVSGQEFTEMLQERFQTKVLDWARVSSSAEGGSDPNEDMLLRQSGSMVDKGKEIGGALPSSKLIVRRCMDANAAEPSSDPIAAVKFHPSGRMLMAAGGDKKLRFFQIDGDKNEKIMCVRFNDLSISKAAFLGNGSEVVLSGRTNFFYSYETTTGAITKIPGLMGKGLKSHEHMFTSPLGTRIAFIGAGGYVHIVCGRLKTWQMDVKMNCSCSTVSFLDEDTVTTSGVDANVYIWDLRSTGRCINKIVHDDGTSTTTLGTLSLDPGSGSGMGYMAVGAASGVVTLYKGDLRSRLRGLAANSGAQSNAPTPIKSVMNLTTRVTSIAFHSSGELVALASSHKKNQLRLVHLPSCTVFDNWPTEKTPLNKVTCLDFSPGGAYFAFGEDHGRVLLYRLNHYETA